MFAGKHKFSPLPLNHIKVQASFKEWGLDFMGEIHPPSSDQHKWILTAIDYFTKWVEAIPSQNAIDSVVIKFLEENIITRFGFPQSNFANNSQSFSSNKIKISMKV